MFRIPKDFDISEIVGRDTSQFRIGQYDLQFKIGEISFSIWSPITLFRQGKEIGTWRPDSWPSGAFFEILNVSVSKYQIIGDTDLVIYFENGIEMHLRDHTTQYESMQIGPFII